MLGCGCGYLERVRIWHFGAVTEINSNLHEVITPGETADIDGFVLEKGNGDDAELYHAYTNLSGALNDAEDGDTITLYTDSSETVETNEKITFDLNGHNLSGIQPADGFTLITNEDGSQQIVDGHAITISLDPAADGTAVASVREETVQAAEKNDAVILTATAVFGYHFINVDAGRHGDVTVRPSRAERGETVTITVEPDTGYELDDLIVTDSDGDEIFVRSKGDNKDTFTMPSGRVPVEATFLAVEEEHLVPFYDGRRMHGTPMRWPTPMRTGS